MVNHPNRGKTQEVTDPVTKAWRWYEKHKEHVDRIMNETTVSHPPCREDLWHPEIWKAASWRYLIKEHPHLAVIDAT